MGSIPANSTYNDGVFWSATFLDIGGLSGSYVLRITDSIGTSIPITVYL